MAKRRTKKAYTSLFDNPSELFGKGTETILYPNGQAGEIWIRDNRGNGFRIKVSAGPCGLGLTVSRFSCGPAMTVTGNSHGSQEQLGQHDASEVTVTQYLADAYSQAHKAWYADSSDPKHPHPSTLGLKPAV